MHGSSLPVEIDGSIGEGGGQVLRSALALSILSGRSLHLWNIRAGREKPGLRAQHLKAVDAAAAVSQAEVHGAALGSMELHFEPHSLRSGRYRFEISTAGAATLVLQTIFLPLCMAGATSPVIITGGTHVPWSPCYHYLEMQWLPYLRQMGFVADLTLDQAGFYPQGRGRISAILRPAGEITPLNLTERGELLSITGLSAVANLNPDIAERQKRQALRRLQADSRSRSAPVMRLKVAQLPSPVKGTLLLLHARFEGGSACFFDLGALGKPAERVADEAVDALLAFIDSQAAIDHYLADQLLLPLCLASGPSELYTNRVTAHLLTNADVMRAFLPVQIDVDGQPGEPGLVRLSPKGAG